MGKVIIIKNIDKDNEIYQFAQGSIKGTIERYYCANLSNEKYLQSQREKLREDEDIVVLLITYNKANEEVYDVFAGECTRIVDNKVYYIMKCHWTNEHNKTVINGILDKIDLNLKLHFEPGVYMLVSEMECLYEELMERLNASSFSMQRHSGVYHFSGEKYFLSSLAQSETDMIYLYQDDCKMTNSQYIRLDREKVAKSKAFRRMVDKAQIFSSSKGDYYRTRMTHTLEVNQIAKRIAGHLQLNLDLTEAIALGHDLGHTPFGHQGERTLHSILKGETNLDIGSDDLFEKHLFGGFKHNYQSAKILTELETSSMNYPGLNVSVQTIEGVIKHTKLNPSEIDLLDFISEEYKNEIYFDNQKEQVCATLEGQVVAIADEIAQRGHDLDDALTSGVLTEEELLDSLHTCECDVLHDALRTQLEHLKCCKRNIPNKKELEIEMISDYIQEFLVDEIIKYSSENIMHCELESCSMSNKRKLVDFAPKTKKINSYIERVVQKKVICNNEVARADYNASVIITNLFKKYYLNPRLLHEGTLHKMFLSELNHKNEDVRNSAVSLIDTSDEIARDEIEILTKKDVPLKLIEEYLDEKTTSGFTNEERKEIVTYEKRRILIRGIVDYIAGMTDGYAIREYEKLL